MDSIREIFIPRDVFFWSINREIHDFANSRIREILCSAKFYVAKFYAFNKVTNF